MIVNCQKIADKKTKSLIKKIKKTDNNLQLDIIYIGKNPASNLFVEKKKQFGEKIGVKINIHKFKKTVSEPVLNAVCKNLNFNPNVTGYFFQLPLSSSLTSVNILDKIAPEKDVDCLTSENLGQVVKGVKRAIRPATVESILSILKCTNSRYRSKKYTIINDSNLIGKPLASVLLNKGATVTVCNEFTKDLDKHTKQADVVITAVGKKDLITENMISKDILVVDAGICRFKGKTYGDVDTQNVSVKADVTPVPKGVGPLTIISLFENLFKLYKLQHG